MVAQIIKCWNLIPDHFINMEGHGHFGKTKQINADENCCKNFPGAPICFNCSQILLLLAGLSFGFHPQLWNLSLISFKSLNFISLKILNLITIRN